MPILGDLGVTFELAESGRCRCSMPVAARVVNPFGALHGGITLTLADSGMGVASGVYPAQRAVLLNPVTALKYE